MPSKHETLGERSKRYAHELKVGKNTLTGEDLNGKTASFRMGVLNERKHAAKVWKYKKRAAQRKRSIKRNTGKSRKG